jgi:hypothetical protein
MPRQALRLPGSQALSSGRARQEQRTAICKILRELVDPYVRSIRELLQSIKGWKRKDDELQVAEKLTLQRWSRFPAIDALIRAHTSWGRQQP